jgi:tRNA 5-methylaminomethyl-2-thiouridine biosynthesis bifunctional protein
MTMSHTERATLTWPDGQPYSEHFGDVYFSRDSGLDETRHVFLQHNRLTERWADLSQSQFTIAETGFGTGLNFLCAWQLWRETAPANARLHFISLERFPLTHDDLQRALSLWPTLADEAGQLLAQYSLLSPGWHRLHFDGGRICLTLVIGDALVCLPQISAKVDAWFLDGFAPARNPEMWQQAVFDQMARLSTAGTTFATFTSAGIVKRGLQQAGFTVRKTAGYGKKREMLCGAFQPSQSMPAEQATDNEAFKTVKVLPDILGGKPPQAIVKTVKVLPDVRDAKASHAVVIGGGIAGTSSAHALATRGWQVTLIERHASIAQEASGNPAGVLYPRLAGQDIVLSRLALHGYLNTLRLIGRLGLTDRQHAQCGLLQTAFDARELARCEAVSARGLPPDVVRLVDVEEASAIAGMPLQHPSLYFPAAGWVDPVAFCWALASHPAIRVITHRQALELRQTAEGWQVWDTAEKIASAPVVIVAGANETSGFAQTGHLPLEPVRGQLSFINANEASSGLKTVLCSDGYISPALDGRHVIGATFSAEDSGLEIREADHEANLAMLRRLCPTLHAHLDSHGHTGRVALRCATPDYLPMAGPVLDSAALLANPPRHTADPASLPWLPGLYVNTGHGSKGLINAPLCAEMLASALCGEPAPVDDKLLAALDPNRFLLRKMGLKRLVAGLSCQP